MGGGLLRYDGAKHADFADPSIMMHQFTIVKPINNVTRNVKAWDKYRVRGWEIDKHTNCIYFKRGVFKLLKYEPTLTVLYGKDV
jgi:hypothetical protein